MERRVSITDLKAMKKRGERFAMITAYDYPGARLVEEAGVPIILVGDSLGMVVLGYDSTVPVTMEEMLHHVKAVARGARRAHIVADMPFLSYQASVEDALRNAGRFLQEGGAAAVKLESSPSMLSRVAAIAAADIPVMAHLGLSPQSVHKMGGYKVQGRDPGGAQRLLDGAKRAEDAGAFALLIEGVPMAVARDITRAVSIPTIGIGVGAACDGQVIVLHDLLGLFDEFSPKFIKRYVNLREIISTAVTQYKDEVMNGQFPSEKESY